MTHKGAKPRTIKRRLRAKIDDWLKTINDPKLTSAIREDVIVTGGSIASMLLGEPVHDFDVYFRTKETTKRVADYYANFSTWTCHVVEKTATNIKGEEEERVAIFIPSLGVVGDNPNTDDENDDDVEQKTVEELEKYRLSFLSENAITLTNKLQIVIRFYGEPDQIHTNYDFRHATNYYTYHDDHLDLKADALADILSRTLTYRGSLYPIASLFRLRKFIERGWRITAGEVLKIAWQISEIDLTNHATLQEQLTGVDAAYFHEILAILTSPKVDGTTPDINSSYVAEVIDRVFNR